MTHTKYSRRASLGALLGFAALAGLACVMLITPGRTSPPTQAVTAAPPPGREVATFAAGCFWSMEAIFKQLKGVEKIEPGYAGGTLPHPSYDQVETGTTGYAESVNITYDPKVISYRDLLQVLLVARDPTTPDQQGPDSGPQYRSVIFYRNAAQQKTAEQAIQQVNASHTWKSPIVTQMMPFKSFYRAEGYHLDYYRLHPYQPYCQFVIAPEVADFRAKFKSKLK